MKEKEPYYFTDEDRKKIAEISKDAECFYIKKKETDKSDIGKNR